MKGHQRRMAGGRDLDGLALPATCRVERLHRDRGGDAACCAAVTAMMTLPPVAGLLANAYRSA